MTNTTVQEHHYEGAGRVCSSCGHSFNAPVHSVAEQARRQAVHESCNAKAKAFCRINNLPDHAIRFNPMDMQYVMTTSAMNELLAATGMDSDDVRHLANDA